MPPNSQAASFRRPGGPGQRSLEPPRNGLAGVVHRFERDLRDRAAVLDHVLEALTDKTALGRREILNRPAMRELAQALKVALELLLSQAVPLPRGVLKGLGQHGPELRDCFHVLPGLPGEPFALLPGEAQRARELIGGILEPLRGRIDAALHRLPGVLCRPLAEIGQLFDPGSGGIAVFVGLLVSLGLLASVRASVGGCHLVRPTRRCCSEAQMPQPAAGLPCAHTKNCKSLLRVRCYLEAFWHSRKLYFISTELLFYFYGRDLARIP